MPETPQATMTQAEKPLEAMLNAEVLPVMDQEQAARYISEVFREIQDRSAKKEPGDGYNISTNEKTLKIIEEHLPAIVYAALMSEQPEAVFQAFSGVVGARTLSTSPETSARLLLSYSNRK